MDGAIYLIDENPTQRPDGTWTTDPTRRLVLCKVMSVNRAEFFGANRNGLNPAYRFDVAAVEYNGETVVEYNGETYAVYRTHQSDANTYVTTQLRDRRELLIDYVELYVQRHGGNIGILAADNSSG